MTKKQKRVEPPAGPTVRVFDGKHETPPSAMPLLVLTEDQFVRANAGSSGSERLGEALRLHGKLLMLDGVRSPFLRDTVSPKSGYATAFLDQRHDPSPWRASSVDDTIILASNGALVCTIAWADADGAQPRNRANKRLVEQAPTLAELLSRIVELRALPELIRDEARDVLTRAGWQG